MDHIDESRLTGWRLVLDWILLCIATGLLWWALIEYVLTPTLHMLGGIFRMAAIR
jgi:hypothetical protein